MLLLKFAVPILVVCLCRSEDVRHKKPEIYSLHIFSDIKYRFSTTRVTSRVKNAGNASREAVFDVILPNQAFITNLTLEIDGDIVVGEIKEKEAAKQQYEEAKQKGESAGYIGTQNRETNRFQLAINVASEKKVSFNLTYQELLKRTRGHYEQVVYIDPGQKVKDMSVTVAILESRDITSLDILPLRNDTNNNLMDVKTISAITRPSPTSAYVMFTPTVDQQMAGQFVVQYDVERKMDVGEVLVVNGYFVHFFAPKGFQRIPNDVLFILDTSGSMSGNKIKQLREAMLAILPDLREGDRINIMRFSTSAFLWKEGMQDITLAPVKSDAQKFVTALNAHGGTNIEAALREGITFLTKVQTEDKINARSPIIVFLTDGQATNGVTRPDAIIESLQKANSDMNIPIFTLAFGNNADFDLIRKIALRNGGFARKIYEASDAALQISGFYDEISVTLLTDIKFRYLDAPVRNVTQTVYPVYFQGSEMVISGYIPDSVPNDVRTDFTLEVTSNTIEGPKVLMVTKAIDGGSFGVHKSLMNSGDFEMITEKVWAYITIKQMLDKELISDDVTEKKALKDEVLRLSFKYGFVTPLTAMVVTVPLNKPQQSQHGRIAEDQMMNTGAGSSKGSGRRSQTQYYGKSPAMTSGKCSNCARSVNPVQPAADSTSSSPRSGHFSIGVLILSFCAAILNTWTRGLTNA